MHGAGGNWASVAAAHRVADIMARQGQGLGLHSCAVNVAF